MTARLFGTIASLSVVFLVAGDAQARPYGMAGCGLGAIVMGADGGQIFAATTNGTFYSQFFGITSGTSNCVDSGGASAAIDQKAFLRTNYADLMKDAARGQGQYLTALATVLGCESASHARLFEMTQGQHAEIFSEQSSPEQSLVAIKQAAEQDPVLAVSCARI